MADEKLVEDLADAMHTACDGPTCDCSPGAREEFAVCAEAALEWLAERGRLVPDGAEVVEQLGILHEASGHGVSFSAPDWESMPDDSTDEDWAREFMANPPPGTRRMELRRRQIITTRWVPVPEESTDG